MSDQPYDDDTELDHEEAESDTGASSAIAAAVTAADPPKRPSAKKPAAVLPSGNNANVFGLAYHPLTEAAFGHVVPCNFGKDANFGNSDYFM